MRLIYSKYDKGWYWERDSDFAVSQLFKTKRDAKQAKRLGDLEWSK